MLDVIIMADASAYTSPVTMAYSIVEKVVTKEPKYPSALPKEKQAKFDRMAKEDFIKDDPHADMWDKNWISAVQPIETVEVKPVVINKPPMVIKKKIRHHKKRK
jgi:hypothetical protein